MGITEPSFLDGGKPPLVVIAGPTASGKSSYALRCAEKLEAIGKGSVILNADSAQVYRDRQVLSARPSADEMGGIPHRLYGFRDGADPYSAAAWAADARQAIRDAHLHGVVPILVGGTGMYIATLLDGIAPIPAIDPSVREQVRRLDQVTAYEALNREDPGSARRLAPADKARTLRALEVIRSTGVSIGEWRGRREGGIASNVSLSLTIIEPDRSDLYAACDERFEHMLANGAIDEVESLQKRNLAATLPVMRAIGVAEIAAYLEGRLSRSGLVQKAQQSTRNYAKRQMTWFRHQLSKHSPTCLSSNKVT